MVPMVLSQLATGLCVLAGAALVKSVMNQQNPMAGLGRGQFPRCPSCTGTGTGTGRVSCFCSRWSDGDIRWSGRMGCTSCGGTGIGRPIPVQLTVRPPKRPS